MEMLVHNGLVVSIETTTTPRGSSAVYWVTKRFRDTYDFVGSASVGVDSKNGEPTENAKKFYIEYLSKLFDSGNSSPLPMGKLKSPKEHREALAIAHIKTHRTLAPFKNKTTQTKAEAHLAKIFSVGHSTMLLARLDSLPLTTIQRRVSY